MNSELLLQLVNIPGTGTLYRLSIGREQEQEAAEVRYKEPPTWKELIDDCIAYCLEENICLSFLAEQGGIRRGTLLRYSWPKEVKLYIVEQNILNFTK